MSAAIIEACLLSDTDLAQRTDLRTIPLKRPPVDHIRHIFNTCDAIRTPIGILENNLFSAGLSVSVKNQKFEIEKSFRQAIETEWMRFSRDLVRALMCFGFALVDVNTQRVPLVVDMDTVDVAIIMSRKGRAKYYAYRIVPRDPAVANNNGASSALILSASSAPGSQDEGPQDLIIFELEPPTYDGFVTSIMATFRSSYMEAQEMLAIQKRGMANAACPPLITEDSSPAANPDVADRARDRSQLGDTSRYYNSQMQELDRKVVEAGATNNAHNFLYNPRHYQVATQPPVRANEPNSANGGYAVPTPVQPLFYRQQNDNLYRVLLPDGTSYANPRISLERGRHLVMGPTPIISLDLVGFRQWMEWCAGNCTGVPRGLWGGQMDASIAQNETVLNTMYTTVQFWNKIVVHAIKYMLNYIYGLDLLIALTHHYDDSRSPEENYDDGEFVVCLPYPMDPAALRQALESGWIRPEVQSHYVSAVHGIPRDHVAARLTEPASGMPMQDIVATDRKLQNDSMQLDNLGKMAQIMTTLSQPAAPAKGASSSSSAAPQQPLKIISIDKLGPKLQDMMRTAYKAYQDLMPQFSPESEASMARASKVRLENRPERRRANPKTTNSKKKK